MSIKRGDFVRPNHLGLDLPIDSVWRVVCTAGALKLAPVNDSARTYRDAVTGRRYHEHNFTNVTRTGGQWVDSPPDELLTGRMSSSPASLQNLPKIMFADAVTAAKIAAEVAAAQASWSRTAYSSMVESARKVERQRQKELREALAAKAKADKEAAARAKVEEARKALAARLHADRCLAEATLALVGEVSRLHNGGCERPAESSIATHCDQLQELARSYGYRIAKPSMIALVVKL